MKFVPLRRCSRKSVVVALGLLVVVLAGLDTVSTAKSVQSHGNAAARALTAVPSELDANEMATAKQSITVAENQLAAARGALGQLPLRLADGLPLARSYIEDAERLVAAATVMADAGRRIARLDNLINGTGGFLFWSQQIDLHTLRAHAALAGAISQQLARARAELDAVTYVPGGGSLLAARHRALTSIDELAATVGVLQKPKPIAAALGSKQPRHYLVIARDDSVSLPSGGTPIATAVVTVRRGALSVRPGPRPTVRSRWSHVPSDTWLAADRRRHSLVDGLAAPTFPVAAREALRWAGAVADQPFDGVVSIDAGGIARFLSVTGSDELPPGVNGQTALGLLSPSSALAPRAFAARAGRILVATLRQAVDVRYATSRLNALGLAAAAGDLKIYSSHGKTQSLLVQHGLSGAFPTVTEDEVGLTVAGPTVPVTGETTQRVSFTPSGGTVARTTSLTVPSTATVTEYAPISATGVRLTVDGVSATGEAVGAVNGRQTRTVTLPPGSHTLRLGYRLLRTSVTHPGGIYSIAVDGQPGLAGPTTVQVLTDSGGREATPGSGWSRSGDGYQIELAGGSRKIVTLRTAPATGFGHWLWDSGGGLLGWLPICGLLAYVGRRKLWVPVGAAIALYGAVPMSAGQAVTGTGNGTQGSLDLHPATWLVLITTGVLIRYSRGELLAVAWRDRANRIVSVLVSFLLLDAVATALAHHSQGWSQITQSLLAAPLLALLVLVAVRRQPGTARRVGAAILGFALFLGLLAVLEALVGRNLVYAADYDNLKWAQVFARHGFRAATTLDEPLNTGLVLVAALALARVYLSGRSRWAAMTILLLGVVATGSRTALLIGVGYAGWSFARTRPTAKHSAPTSRGRRVGYALMATALMVGVLLTPPGLRLIQRGLADGGSGGLRLDGLRAFLPHLPTHLLFGSGVGTSEHLTRAWMHSANSAENPLVMTAVDLGVVGAAALVIALLWLARMRWRRSPSFLQQAFLLAVAASLGYSSFATTSVAVIAVWLFAALAAAEASGCSEPDVAPPAAVVKRDAIALPAGLVRLPPRVLVPSARSDVPSTPVVSAIMAARDAADTIDRAVASVLAQSFTDWELIVVDDCSSDDTAEVVRDVAAGDPRVRVLRSVGRGRGAARNTAVMQARGRYVAICDADDWSRENRFETQVAYLDGHPEIGVIGAQVANFGPWGGPEIVYRYPTDPDVVRNRLRRGHNPIPHQAAMARRDIMRRVGGYDTECVRAQDLELFLRLNAITAMTNLDEVLVDYRHSRRTSLTYWLDNGRWRRFAVARAQAAEAVAAPPEAATFHRRPTASLATVYDVASYARSRYVLSRRGVRSL